MHTLLDFSGMLIIIAMGCSVILWELRHARDWKSRRHMQLLILAMPLVSIIVLIGGLLHITLIQCIIHSPAWDHRLDILFLTGISMIPLGAILLGGLRHVFMRHLLQQKETFVDKQLQASVDRWAQRQGLAAIRIRLWPDTQPLALLYGIRQPTILLSTWMLEHLDKEELEAVLMHELMHVTQRDYICNWAAILLRDAFFYLPTSQKAYQHFHREKELACDDLVIQATKRPLALASALTKVWLYFLNGTSPNYAPLVQPLADKHEHIVQRISRLMDQKRFLVQEPSPTMLDSRSIVMCVLILVIATGLTFMLAEIMCWPDGVLWHFI